MYVEQVFFVDAREEPGWKVIMRKEVRGRRVHGTVGAEDACPMFDMGADIQHEGLVFGAVVREENPPRATTGRTVRRHDVFSEQEEEEWLVLDRDLGESETSSDDE